MANNMSRHMRKSLLEFATIHQDLLLYINISTIVDCGSFILSKLVLTFEDANLFSNLLFPLDINS